MDTLILIFTDLDGTFLDHHDYSFLEAVPCLDFIRKHNIPIIFTSSKTSTEIKALCYETKLFHPYIAENGALLFTPKNYFLKNEKIADQYEKKQIGISREKINRTLTKLNKEFKFRSFSNLSTPEIIELTGLNEKQAVNANQRECTEPIIWEDKQSSLTAFSEKLNKLGLNLLKGGRFHHVMGPHDKATTMSFLIQQYNNHNTRPIISIALGDSPNDLEMLKTADYGVLIPNQHSAFSIDESEKIIYAKHEGPRGWNETLLKLLKDFFHD